MLERDASNQRLLGKHLIPMSSSGLQQDNNDELCVMITDYLVWIMQKICSEKLVIAKIALSGTQKALTT